eukprot:CAMPEP_0119546244 /NCGR_PEP_ID=MMETSP1352-20130426/748_1 /TAXON_ID=265584 /ORGANISM="Stauroneis constricta, Strain CCMP1120" /LENGTH=97 /DNA_ID=CAMNT_0007590929 /DNA_START=276 /DNA_END=569 /DNA_ORIENTATION=+
MACACGMQNPHLGYNDKPAMATAGGTSSSHGSAAVMARQKAWSWIFMMEHPSTSHLGPQQMHGKHGAPALQHTSMFMQQRPTLPEHPGQSMPVYKPQ